MPLFRLLSMNWKRVLRSNLFFIAFAVSLGYSLFSFLADALPLFRSGATSGLAAWSYWGPMEKGVHGISQQLWEAFYVFLMPFVAALPFSSSYFEDRDSGMLKNLLSRCNRNIYLAAGAFTVFFTGFAVIFIPLAVNQLLWLIAAPVQSITTTFSDQFLNIMFFPYIYARAPYLLNFIYMVIPSALGGLLALCSFSFSLFYRKRKFIVLTAAGFVYILSCYLSSTFGKETFDLYNYMTPVPAFLGWSLPFLIASYLVLLFINAAAIAVKVRFTKDEL